MIPAPHPSPPTGLLGHGVGLLAAAVRYARARLTLAGLEAKEAGAHYGLAAALLVGALFIVHEA